MTAQEAALLAKAKENKQLQKILGIIDAYAYMGLYELRTTEEVSEETEKSLTNLGFDLIKGTEVSAIYWTAEKE
jgi:hypothetical protein